MHGVKPATRGLQFNIARGWYVDGDAATISEGLQQLADNADTHNRYYHGRLA